tara:strand:- start:601 stop:1560 length:960 start_codon:yes stop_codon:yes gene_type:complete
MNLKYKYAIGCLVQWYEVEILGEYIESVNNALEQIDNKENVMVDFHVNMNQDLEKCDEVYSLKEIEEKLKNLLENDNFSVIFTYDKIYTIADYRRKFNDKYCTKVDVLMWGETDSLIPRQTFMILDGLHHQTKDKTPKYIATFGICKMWDDSWKPIEHSEFTDKPFIENDYDNWWSLKYTMNINEMNKFNDKVTELNVQVWNSFKFNGCGLVFSSELVKCGANIPKSVFFVHEDTSFMLSIQRMFGNTIPQFIVKNILIVHNRNHPKKRMYVKGETGDTMNLKRRSNDWYVKANKMSEENCYNAFNQIKSYSWEDVFDD